LEAGKPAIAAIQRALDGEASGNLTGAVVAVLASDTLQVATFARSGFPPPFRPDSRFLLYSFTKTIVAAALLRFVAMGRLSLEETLERWLPEYSPAARLTLRDVLTHAGGVPDYGGLAAYHAAVRASDAPWSEDEFLARTDADKLLFTPGHGWAYSNIGYMLLRRVLIRIGGDDMEAVLRREVFDPLAIATASVPLRQADLAAFDFGPSRYLAGDGPPVRVSEHYDPGWIAPGVIGASAADAARVLDGILGWLLPLSLREEMMRPAARFPTAGPGRPWRQPAYGLGLMIDLDETRGPIYGHTGSGPGCTVAVYHFPRRDPPLTIAVATDGEDQGLAETILLEAAATR
jgi:CubicO group peptidase (beta-lactamase class C family)